MTNPEIEELIRSDWGTPEGASAAVPDSEAPPHQEGAWIPVDLVAVAAAGLDRIEPDVLFRRDGRALLYSGKLNVIFAAPEAGKTWIAIIGIAQLVAAASDNQIIAVFIDYEDDAVSYLTRLRDAGVTPEQAAEHTRYYSIAQALRTAPVDLDGLATARLIVVDTTNSAMTLDDLDPLSNAEALRFINDVRRLRNGNPGAWLLLDHEPISTSTGRRQAIGAQSKLGAVDGAQYRAAAVQQPRPGADGVISLHVTKDRAGGVRQYATAPNDHGIQHAATLYMNPRAAASDGRFDWSIIEPQGAAGDSELRDATVTVCDDWYSRQQIRTLVRGDGISRRNEVMNSMIDELTSEGALEAKPKGNYVVYKAVDKSTELGVPTSGIPPIPKSGTPNPSGHHRNPIPATEIRCPESVGDTGDDHPSPVPTLSGDGVGIPASKEAS